MVQALQLSLGGGLVLQPQQPYAGGQDGGDEEEDRPHREEGDPTLGEINIDNCTQQREGGTDAGGVGVPSPGYEPEVPIETPDKDGNCEEESTPEQGEEEEYNEDVLDNVSPAHTQVSWDPEADDDQETKESRAKRQRLEEEIEANWELARPKEIPDMSEG